MSRETRKLYQYRADNGYGEFFRGRGVDIGCGPDALALAGCVVDPYDREQGDANICANIEDSTYDFVYSSHCLEHMIDPWKAFKQWMRICKSGGYMVHAVPHEVFYEKCQWPSRFNSDHKWSWTLEWKSNLPKTVHIPEFLAKFDLEIIRLETILLNFDFMRFCEDQTVGSATTQIEFVGRKR